MNRELNEFQPLHYRDRDIIFSQITERRALSNLTVIDLCITYLTVKNFVGYINRIFSSYHWICRKIIARVITANLLRKFSI